MMLRSSWTITFDLGGSDEFELVEAGGWLDEEIAVEWADAVESWAPLEADHAAQENLGGRAHTLRVGVYHDHADNEATRAFILSNTAAVPKQVKAVLTIAIEGTGAASYTLADCVIESGVSRTVPKVPFRTFTEYRLRGGALELVVVEE